LMARIQHHRDPKIKNDIQFIFLRGNIY